MDSRSAVPVLARGFLPTWFALAGIVAVQMLTLMMLPEPQGVRAVEWSFDASLLLVLAVSTITAAWAFPRVRAMSWLIGAMSATLLALRHTVVAFHEPVPPASEILAFYVVAAVLLAVGAYERSRVVPAIG